MGFDKFYIMLKTTKHSASLNGPQFYAFRSQSIPHIGHSVYYNTRIRLNCFSFPIRRFYLFVFSACIVCGTKIISIERLVIVVRKKNNVGCLFYEFLAFRVLFMWNKKSHTRSHQRMEMYTRIAEFFRQKNRLRKV